MNQSEKLSSSNLRSSGGFLSRPLFLMAPYKAGSTMLFLYTRSICRLLNVSYVDYAQHIWESGGDLPGEYYANPSADDMLSEPLVYLGNRQAVTTLSTPAQAKCASLMMIRDPRDCLVSMYFSFLHSHAKPRMLKKQASCKNSLTKEGSDAASLPDINDYVLQNADWYKTMVTQMFAFGKQTQDCLIIRYENVVCNKQSLCNYLYQAIKTNLSPGNVVPTTHQQIARSYIPAFLHSFVLHSIARSQDKIPEKENPNLHVRKALPGDHAAKLNSATIGQLNDIYSDILSSWYSQ